LPDSINAGLRGKGEQVGIPRSACLLAAFIVTIAASPEKPPAAFADDYGETIIVRAGFSSSPI
jgi:hypothetical protein